MTGVVGRAISLWIRHVGPTLCASTGERRYEVELDLDCVQSFVVLASILKFAQAATRLNLSPSALTKRIQRLEIQVGTPLFERHPGGQASLTAAGRRFLPHAETLVDEARAARNAARAR